MDDSSPPTSGHSESSRSSGDSKTDRDYVSHPILFNKGDDDGFDEDEDLVCIKRADLELLYLKERAMDVVHEGITIADASLPDMPLIYINDGFRKIMGYPVGAVKNKNCRFLQGKGTDERTVTKLRNAIKGGRPCTVQLMNYRKDGHQAPKRHQRWQTMHCAAYELPQGRHGVRQQPECDAAPRPCQEAHALCRDPVRRHRARAAQESRSAGKD